VAATERPAYRRHAPAVKEQVCQEIRSGQIGRREAQQRYGLSDNLLHQWLCRYDHEQVAGTVAAEQRFHAVYAEKIHALERKIGELVMALERCGCDAPAPPKP
jgi:transposase-like protein